MKLTNLIFPIIIVGTILLMSIPAVLELQEEPEPEHEIIEWTYIYHHRAYKDYLCTKDTMMIDTFGYHRPIPGFLEDIAVQRIDEYNGIQKSKSRL